MSIIVKASFALTFLCAYPLVLAAKGGTPEHISALVNQGRYEQVLIELNELDDTDKTIETSKIRALALFKLGQYDQAELSYLSIKELDDGVDVNNNLGLIYLRQSRLPEAIRLFRRNISRFPADPVAYKNLGDVYLVLAKLTYKKGAVATEGAANLAERATKITALINADFVSGARPNTVKTDELTGSDTALKAVPELGDNELSKQPKLELENVSKDVSVLADTTSADIGDKPVSQNFARGREPEIEAFLKSWASSLSNKEVDAYLRHYVNGTDSYNAAKSRSLSLPDELNVNPDEPKITFVSENVVSVVFDEWTGPRGSRSRVFKEFKLGLSSQGWEIVEEKILFSYR